MLVGFAMEIEYDAVSSDESGIPTTRTLAIAIRLATCEQVTFVRINVNVEEIIVLKILRSRNPY